ncbi:MAG: C39 family peptidase [Eubacteriales bacterium]|nr:C39 family peptidase [Eubacteriales bacterium]
MANNRRRRKLSRKGKIKVAIFCLKVFIPIIILCFLVKGCVSLISKNDKVTIAASFKNVTDKVKESDEYVKATTKPTEEEMKKYIKENKDLYPSEIRTYYKDYPEALEFVYNYPEKKDEKPSIDLSEEYKEGEVPLLLQWDERWGYQQYGEGMICITGCGPTCMSMVYIGLTGDITKDPLVMSEFAEEKGYYAEGTGTIWAFMSEGATELGIQAEELMLDESAVKDELEKGHPVILSMSGDAFSVSGQYIVLTGVENDQFKVHDPYSRENSEKLWSWKDFGEQIGNLWVYSVQE